MKPMILGSFRNFAESVFRFDAVNSHIPLTLPSQADPGIICWLFSDSFACLLIPCGFNSKLVLRIVILSGLTDLLLPIAAFSSRILVTALFLWTGQGIVRIRSGACFVLTITGNFSAFSCPERLEQTLATSRDHLPSFSLSRFSVDHYPNFPCLPDFPYRLLSYEFLCRYLFLSFLVR